ncbi:hypothetical protein DL765_003206 [Monosporascus sp. GIB2]|nr:hypothetical protein DL765_003206 [Monosporascus sp. GIB2]
MSSSMPTDPAPGRALPCVPYPRSLLPLTTLQCQSTNEPSPGCRSRPATQADGEFMAETLRHLETKIEIPPAPWPKIAAAGRISVFVSVYRRVSDWKAKKDEDEDEEKT